MTRSHKLRFLVIDKYDYCRSPDCIFKPESLKFKCFLINKKSIPFNSSHLYLYFILKNMTINFVGARYH